MKKMFFILPAALVTIVCCSCSNNQAASAGVQDDKAVPASSPPAPSSGDFLFSATIDGQTYISKVTAGEENIAVNQIADDKQSYAVFNLGDIKSADDLKITRNFRIVAAKKIGSAHLSKETEIPNYGMNLDYFDGDFSQYREEDMILNITAISDTRVKGNFSGKMYNNTPRGLKKYIMVNAKFDIPVAPPISPS